MPTLTLEITGAQASRIQAAVEETAALDRAATMDDLKDIVVYHLKQYVKKSERRAAQKAADLSVTELTLTWELPDPTPPPVLP